MKGQCINCGLVFKYEKEAEEHAAYSNSCGLIQLVDETQKAEQDARELRKNLMEAKELRKKLMSGILKRQIKCKAILAMRKKEETGAKW